MQKALLPTDSYLMSNTVTIIETEAALSPRRQALDKAKRWSSLLAKFVSVQIIVQAIGLVAGIFLVRMLSQRQYAYFTIANTMQGTISILADSGISVGLSAIGGKVWHDRYRFGQLINTALRLRKTLAAGAVLIVTPILIWMLIKNGASAIYAVLVAVAVLVGVSAQLTTGVLEVVPRLHSQVNRLQTLDFYSAMSRLLLLGGAYLVSLNAAFAVLAASASLLLKNRLLSRWIKGDVDMDAPPLAADRAEISSIIKYQMPTSIFYCVQGQVTVWLISIFGSTKNIAEIGALGRLVVVFSIVSSVLVNIALPVYARCQVYDLMRRRYWQILGAYTSFCLLVLALIAVFPNQALWVLGKHYSNLQSELVWMALGTIISGFAATTYALNTTRGWVKFRWHGIPLTGVGIPSTIATQAVLLLTLDVSSVKGVVLFGVLSTVPSIVLNTYTSLLGFRQARFILS